MSRSGTWSEFVLVIKKIFLVTKTHCIQQVITITGIIFHKYLTITITNGVVYHNVLINY